MKFTKIVFAAALLIGAAHVSDAQAVPTLADFKKGVSSKMHQAQDAFGSAKNYVGNSRVGQAASGFGHSVADKARAAGSSMSNAAHNAANYVGNSRVGQAASGFGHSVAEKARSAAGSMQRGASNLMQRDR